MLDAGIHALVNGNIEPSWEYFRQASKLSAIPLTKVNADICALIAKTIDGSGVEAHEIHRILEYMNVEVDRAHVYHRNHAALSLYWLAKKHAIQLPELHEQVNQVIFGGNFDVRDTRRANEFVGAALGLYNGEVISQPGILGRFLSAHGVSLPVTYIWS